MMTEEEIVRNWKNRAYSDATQLKILHELTRRKVPNLVEILLRNGVEIDPKLCKTEDQPIRVYSSNQWCKAVEDVLNGYTLLQAAKRNRMSYHTVKTNWKKRAVQYGYDPNKRLHRRG